MESYCTCSLAMGFPDETIYLGNLFVNVFPMAGALDTFKDMRADFSGKSQQLDTLPAFLKHCLPPNSGSLCMSVDRSSWPKELIGAEICPKEVGCSKLGSQLGLLQGPLCSRNLLVNVAREKILIT